MYKKLFLATVMSVATTLCAHQVVTQNVGTNKFEVKFWAHGDFSPYKSNQLIDAKAYDESLKEIKTGINYHFGENKTPEVLTAAKPAIIASAFDAGYWVESDKGGDFIDGGKNSVKGVVFSTSRSVKLGKTYFSWNQNLVSPIGLKLEVIALSNPFKLKIGDYLPVLVLKNGEPIEGIGFEVGKEKSKSVTNKFGIAQIEIKEKGLNVIAAIDSEQELNDPNANTLLLQSSISFELK
ncbi:MULTISPECIES: DUF4198 domain-containing protein [Campylobacter]|uniref:DUF4198 domain protein n=1 Tax=Campylobacter porcelli TaxID=1660073 RepID=A0A1X9SY21_9BACT|nr:MULTISPECIES: DUF4198 domain-containing protein [unclassified Campylobacter]MCR8679376.1 DUF4198 domain-containing protein [Campylobacter sp. RM19072]MCR8696518.1 DUF4198 domain-containing protein [Campylobacter sp. RM19073]MEE3705192.1 DUF4198 domain-containing protein [Campylobacter sp. CX2-8023-23]MEE3744922.1 DUF4198 domain-containing protein [Campylobacter sp. CX2-4855-23]MEE3777218.1 DUF4198 domain-containing protein [Campylobacter sp. CX2-4080-23]